MIVAGLMMVSCVDTIILPDDKTVDEDFWKSKSDVQLMVNGAYKTMLNEAIIARLIVWGDLRSEEVLPSTLTGSLTDDLVEINLANTQDDNQFTDWAAFYEVINRCNMVLDRAGEVVTIDPSYTEGDYLSDCSQMLALRSLCYFYLVRNFRDVPYSEVPFMDSSQDRILLQVSPDSVLSNCIRDLEIAEKNAILSTAYLKNDWRRVGYFTKDAINALQADIHLWRACVKHDVADYEKAIAYCDKVIESKRLQQEMVGAGAAMETPKFPLMSGNGLNILISLFATQNSEESLFELQFDGNNNSNNALCQYFVAYRSGSVPYLYASNLMAGGQGVEGAFYSGTSDADWRGEWSTATVSSSSSTEGVPITKFAYDKELRYSGYSTQYAHNYIVYRLTDVMLMKAEALMGIALVYSDNSGEVDDEEETDGTDTDLINDYIAQAFELVYAVNSRAKSEGAIEAATYNTVDKMETLILGERLRELCFEGKRWYDLMRYNYRHITAADYSKTFYELSRNADFVPATTDPSMLNLAKRKLGTQGEAVSAKMANEYKLYMPIPNAQISIYPTDENGEKLLHQNPGYNSSGLYEKN